MVEREEMKFEVFENIGHVTPYFVSAIIVLVWAIERIAHVVFRKDK